MEELYELLNDRFQALKAISDKFQEAANSPKAGLRNALGDTQLQKLSEFLQQRRRAEKTRVMKENNYLEVIYSLKYFDTDQCIRFQQNSYIAMRTIYPDYVFDKYAPTGEIKDISKLYLKFFYYTGMDNKAADLKKNYSLNKYLMYPIISLLAKWLCEITRKHYQDTILAKSHEFMTLLGQIQNLPLGLKKKLADMPKLETPSTTQPTENTERDKPDYPAYTEPNKATIKAPLSTRVYSMQRVNDVGLEQRLQTEGNGTQLQKSRDNTDSRHPALNELLNLRSISSFLKKNTNSSQDLNANPEFRLNMAATKIPGQKLTPRIIHAASMKNLTIGASTTTTNAGSLQNRPKLTVKIIAPLKSATPYDVLEDLDHNSLIGNVELPARPHTAQRLLNIIEIDLEKKREHVCTVFKSLLAKNADIEKKIHNFRLNAEMKQKITYDPSNLPRKGEMYLESLKPQDLLKNVSRFIAEAARPRDSRQKKLRSSLNFSKPSLELSSKPSFELPSNPEPTDEASPSKTAIKKERPSAILNNLPISFYNFTTEKVFSGAPITRKSQKSPAKEVIITTKREKSVERLASSTQNLRSSVNYESLKTSQVAGTINTVMEPSIEQSVYLKKKRRLINASINSGIQAHRPPTSSERILKTQGIYEGFKWEQLSEFEQTNFVRSSSKANVRKFLRASSAKQLLQVGGVTQEIL